MALSIRRPVEYLIYLGVPLLIFSFSSNYSILVSILSTDSMFSAINFFRCFLLNRITEAKIVYESNCLYTTPAIHRYLYYITVSLFYTLCCNIMWVPQFSILKLLVLYSVSPPILTWLTNRVFRSYLQHLESEKRKLIKRVISYQITSFVNWFYSNYLHYDVRFQPTEFYPMLSSYDRSIDHLLDIAKGVGTNIAIKYAKRNLNTMAFNAIKVIYRYKMGSKVDLTIPSAKNHLIGIVKRRNWKELFDSQTYDAMMVLYEADTNTENFWTVITTKFNYKTVCMFSVVTLSSFIRRFWVIFGLKMALKWFLRRNQMFTGIANQLKIGFIVLGCGLGWWVGSFFLASFIAEFGYYLTFNQVTTTIKDHLVHRFHQLVLITHHNNDYNFFLLFTALYFCCIGWLDTYSLYVSIVNVIYLSFNMDDNFKRFSVGLLTFTGLFSSYYYLHVIHNLYFSYILLNIHEFLRMGPRRKQTLTTKIPSNTPPIKPVPVQKSIKIQIMDDYFSLDDRKVEKD